MWFKQGQIEVECGDESEFGSGECGDGCGDGHAEKTSPAGIPLPPLHPTNADILLAITDITTNGNAEDITKVYDSVNKSRLGIAGKLKSIAHIINDSLDNYERDEITDDNTINEINDDLLL